MAKNNNWVGDLKLEILKESFIQRLRVSAIFLGFLNLFLLSLITRLRIISREV